MINFSFEAGVILSVPGGNVMVLPPVIDNVPDFSG
jgi:hypothetical protein